MPVVVVPALKISDEEFGILCFLVEEYLEDCVCLIDFIERDLFSKTFWLDVEDGYHLIRIAEEHVPPSIMESEFATMEFVRKWIPVPKVLAHRLDRSNELGRPYMVLKQVSGIRLATIIDCLPPESQDALVTQFAQFMLKLSHISFPEIGSIVLPLPTDASSTLPPLGPLNHTSFYTDRCTALSIHRGPFRTTRAYFVACAERELAAVARELLTQGAPAEKTQRKVERAMARLIELVGHCEALDNADPELGRYALDLHELGLKDIVVDEDNPTCILGVVGWQSVSVRPLWRCGRTPYWLLSLAGDDDNRKQCLCDVFGAAVKNDLVFKRAVDTGDIRHTLDQLAESDACDNLVSPALELLATLQGEDELHKLLDPQMLCGRNSPLAPCSPFER